MAIRNTFKKYERLKRKQHIDTLFQNGKAFSFSDLRFVYHVVPRTGDQSPVLTGFSVPKKKHKKAVTRNRLRRLLIEAWRLQKAALCQQITSDHQLHLFIIFTGKMVVDLPAVELAMKKGVERLQQEL